MEEHHPLIDSKSSHNITLEFRPDSDDDAAELEERTDKFTPQQLHEVMSEISVLPKEYKVQNQTIEQFIGPAEHISAVEFDALTRFTMNTGQVFERGKLLGAGAQAIVYEATHVAGPAISEQPLWQDQAGRIVPSSQLAQAENVVLKILRVPLGQDPRYTYREISAWADKKKFPGQSLSLVGVKQYDTDQNERIFVLALERGQGYDLESRMQQEGVVREQSTPAFRLELMDAGLACAMELDFMSRPEQGQWVHGDIKPKNILLHGIFSSLLDWGFAHKEAESVKTMQSHDTYGTAEYLSPDKFIPPEAFHRNPDWYDLGLSLGRGLGFMKFYFEIPEADVSSSENNMATETKKFDLLDRPPSDLLKNILNRFIAGESVVVSESLTQENYHTVLQHQFPLSPERDFAWLCYRLVQPHCRPGKYVPAFANYQEIIRELADISKRQRLRLRTKKLQNDLEHFMVSRFQLRRAGDTEEVPRLIRQLQEALTSDQDELMETVAEQARQYFKDTRQIIMGDRPAIKRVQAEVEQADLQVARFKSLNALVTSFITRLITNYGHEGQAVPASFTENLSQGVILAQQYFEHGEPEVGFGILHLMQQDLSRLQLGQERGEKLELRYYDYEELIEEFKFHDDEEYVNEEPTTESVAA